jgi:hypothetical protein
VGTKIVINLGVVIFMALVTGVARADAIPSCPPPPGVRPVSFENAPLALRKTLREKLGDIAPPEATFDATDIVITGRQRRLIFIWVRGYRWIIATERGGRGYNDPILAYDLSSDGLTAKRVAENIAFPNTVCSTAMRSLDVDPSRP